jgi:hypothetical protein
LKLIKLTDPKILVVGVVAAVVVVEPKPPKPPVLPNAPPVVVDVPPNNGLLTVVDVLPNIDVVGCVVVVCPNNEVVGFDCDPNKLPF